MLVTLQAVWTAIDRGYEKIANIEYYIAKTSKVSGDITIYDTGMAVSMEIYANINALESLNINTSPEGDRTIQLILERIKTLTQKLRTWQ